MCNFFEQLRTRFNTFFSSNIFRASLKVRWTLPSTNVSDHFPNGSEGLGGGSEDVPPVEKPHLIHTLPVKSIGNWNLMTSFPEKREKYEQTFPIMYRTSSECLEGRSVLTVFFSSCESPNVSGSSVFSSLTRIGVF